MKIQWHSQNKKMRQRHRAVQVSSSQTHSRHLTREPEWGPHPTPPHLDSSTRAPPDYNAILTLIDTFAAETNSPKCQPTIQTEPTERGAYSSSGRNTGQVTGLLKTGTPTSSVAILSGTHDVRQDTTLTVQWLGNLGLKTRSSTASFFFFQLSS